MRAHQLPRSVLEPYLGDLGSWEGALEAGDGDAELRVIALLLHWGQAARLLRAAVLLVVVVSRRHLHSPMQDTISTLRDPSKQRRGALSAEGPSGSGCIRLGLLRIASTLTVTGLLTAAGSGCTQK